MTKFKVLMISILMFAITGIGQTTSDPTENSTTDMSLVDAEAKVVSTIPVFQVTFMLETNDGLMAVKMYSANGCEFLSFSELIPASNGANYLLTNIKDGPSANSNLNDLFKGELSLFYNSEVKTSNYNKLVERSPRDGLTQS